MSVSSRPALPRTVVFAVATVLMLFLSGCVDESGPSAAPAAGADMVEGDNTTVVDDGTDMAKSQSVADQPHVHDYWNGVEDILLMDDKVPTGDTVRNAFIGVFRAGASVFFGQGVPDPVYEAGFVQWRLPDEVLVYEGTGRIDVQVDFSGLSQAPDAIRLYYKPAHTQDYTEYPEPLANGDTATIDTTYEMADIAHSKASRWAFYARPYSSSPAAVMDGDLGVKVWATKAFDIQEAPAHPDHWANETVRMPLMDATFDWSYARTGFQTEEENMDFMLPEGSIIPPGTGTVEVWLNYTIDSTTVPIDYDLFMSYRTAADSRRQNMGEPETEGPGAKHYVIPTDLSMVDSPYAARSVWEFDTFVFPEQREAFATFFVNEASGTMSVKVVAHKDPAWV